MVRSLSAGALAALLGLLGACTADTARTTAPAPAPSPSVSPAVDEPPGSLACAKVIAAVRDATVMMPGVADTILQATGTADAPVADAAQRLAEAFTAAVQAQGAEDEPDKIAAVSAAAAEMVEICRDSGLESAG
ncbi:hypothetical protein [Winogradskya consettensis]|uniref:hypothetical protein n=1 Tax=Winogradskya consettensis TaxID=113560 RepID=UPI001FD3A6F4|nr:hypothetical protein [Actinoplanes consettensis]